MTPACCPGTRTGSRSRPGRNLAALFSDYKAAVLASKRPEAEACPTASTAFRTAPRSRAWLGAYTPCTRSVSRERIHSTPGQLRAFARKLGLVKGTAAPRKQSWGDFNARDRRVEAVHGCCGWRCACWGRTATSC